MAFLDKINFPEDLKKLKVEDLPLLASEIRELIIETVAKKGGHLSSSLGVVELSIALHYALNTPEDKIVWDVGHQSYAHKILTGRKDQFNTIREFEGLSGFPKRSESEFDPFGTGHSGTSISSAVGFALARDLKGGDNNIVAVIGDGSMTSGIAFEGLNHAGSLHKKLTVV
ncbi:MAG: 1-deoxy-D-xylulose-5-phosphate synthase, partial [Nitrospinae bacterium]|nr:1-deoxy-D-xylulose-5-phosphate synthase [Nitrospinota bacterium]